MKKGQITIFLIIGMVLVLSVALFLYLKEKELIFQPEIIVPTEIESIKKYVEQCVIGMSIEAIERIGMQGGYLEVPRDIMMERPSYLDVALGFYVVPHWYYEGELRIPTFDFIALQISSYLEENLQQCTGDFSPFLASYEIQDSPPKVELVFNDRDMTVLLDYPIRIDDRYENKRTRLDDFAIIIPVDLKAAWSLANKTMHAQLENYYLEYLTLEIMTSDTDNFPFTGLTFECTYDNWKISLLRERLKRLMAANLPRVRLMNTDYAPFEREESFYESYRQHTFLGTMEAINEGGSIPPPISDAAADWYEYFKMFYDVGSESPEMQVSFLYQPEWGMEMHVAPSDGDRLIPRSFPGQGILSFMCFQLYHYTYNVRYPALVRILDPQAFFGRGFTFQFAFPVIIQNNQGAHDVFRVANFEGFTKPYDFCDPIENYGIETYSIQARGMDEDGYPDQPVSGVNISYRCMNRVCDGIAMTGFQGKVETNLPSGCGNPILIGKKSGYLDSSAVVIGNDIIISMEKTRKFNFTVSKYLYDSPSSSFIGNEPLQHFENVTIIIESLDRKQTMTLHYPPIDPDQAIELREEGGDYKIEAILYRQGLDDIEVTGGYFARNITFDYSYFRDSKDIVIPIIDYRPEPNNDDLRYSMWSFLFSLSYNESVRPVFT